LASKLGTFRRFEHAIDKFVLKAYFGVICSDK
jgi:hypothetical protein